MASLFSVQCPVPTGFYLQGKEIVVIACYLIGFQAIFPCIWVMRTGQGKACSWHFVINVLNVYFDHAYLLVIGKHFHGELALGVSLTQCFPVNALLCVQQSALGVHDPEVGFLTLSSLPSLFESKSGIFGNVPNHRPWTLFLRDRVIQVFQCQGLSPQEQEKENRKIHLHSVKAATVCVVFTPPLTC
uniref:Uncharacterized protein n=1 Tax=Stegastes partitus TaxID=144197 RepID=A0A3B4ZYY4_9TELE